MLFLSVPDPYYFFSLLYISFDLRCILSFSVAWEGEQLADMSTAVSNSASYPHVFAHKYISLPPPSGFYCANSRTTETPNGPTPLIPPQPRLLRDFYSFYPIQYLDLTVHANLCQLLVYEAPAVHRPHYSRCTPYIHRTSTSVLSV